ncbi:MAG: opioid growth factor receptor-related protein [Terriglobales bacterium]|jgi:hypothetical protein
MQRWPDDRLETVHDFVQWLFPLPERSGFNVTAPILTPESIEEFWMRPELLENLRVSFVHMLNFYGFEVRLGERITVTRAANFAVKAAGWLSPSNHNHLRITRILRSLSVLGLDAEAVAFFDCLREIYGEEQSKAEPAISEETMRYWEKSVSDSGRSLEAEESGAF